MKPEQIEELKKRLEKYLSHWRNKKFDMDAKSPHGHSIPISGNEAEYLLEMMEKVKKLEFMIENGLGWEDMINDITYPKEL